MDQAQQVGGTNDNTKETLELVCQTYHFWKIASNLEYFSAWGAAWGCLSEECMLFISLLVLVFLGGFQVLYIHLTSEIIWSIWSNPWAACPTASFHWNMLSFISGSQGDRGLMLSAFLPSSLNSLPHVYQLYIHKDTPKPLIDGAVTMAEKVPAS